MWSVHLLAPSGGSPIKICRPTMGRLRLLGSTLLMSVLGLPVCGSLGCRSEAMEAQSPPPQFDTRTVASSSVRQVPVASTAKVIPADRPNRAIESSAAQRSFVLIFVVIWRLAFLAWGVAL